ncbi:MAG: GNAT family N-acetyltransferase [Steroidobacteraceae bacterium]
MTVMGGTIIREARPDEAAACRGMLPDAFPAAGAAPSLFVAADARGLIQGVLAMAWVPRGFPILMHVAEPYRRRGIGRALLRAAIASAQGETPALRCWGPVEQGGVAFLFLQACSFRVIRRLLVFETGGALCNAPVFEASLTALLKRLVAAGKVPRDARLVSLAEAPAAQVVELVAAELAALPQDVARRIAPGATGGYDRSLSRVLMRGSDIAGAMLCWHSGETLEIDVNVVKPELRCGWANVMLLEGVARVARAAGVVRFRFSCEKHIRDTANLARRCGASALPPRLVMAQELGASAWPAET